MVTLQHGDVVAEELVLAVPEACADVLRVHVVGCKNRGALSKRLQGAAKLGELRRAAGSVPRPIIPQIAEVEIVCGVRGDIGGQTSYQIPRLLRPVGSGSGLAERIAREEAADIGLTTRCSLQPIETITAAEVPLRTKVVVAASDSKMGGIRFREIGAEGLFVYAVAAARTSKTATGRFCWSIRGGHEFRPHLLDNRVNTQAPWIASSRPATAVLSSCHVIRRTVCRVRDDSIPQVRRRNDPRTRG